MARFFRLTILPSNKIEADDWVLNTDTVLYLRRHGAMVLLIRKKSNNLTLNFENENQAKDFITTNFLIFNA